MIYIYMYKCMYICHFFLKSDFFRQCQWDTSSRSRRELSNAIVKRDFRLTGVEIWPCPFRKGVILYGEPARGGWGNQGNRGEGTEPPPGACTLTRTVTTLQSKA